MTLEERVVQLGKRVAELEELVQAQPVKNEIKTVPCLPITGKPVVKSAMTVEIVKNTDPGARAAEREAVRTQFETLERLAALLVTWIREHHGPHTDVHMAV